MDCPAGKSEPAVSVEGVSFGYGPEPVLVDVSFAVDAGTFLAVIGPNGSGKTTLIKIILGLLKPGRGRVRLLGQDPVELRERSRIGYVPQKATHFDPFFPASAREVVAMAWMPEGGRTRPAEDGAVRSALEAVGMTEHAGRRIGQLSGGEQQRIFIARAVVNKPTILFLDEPTAGVDAGTQDRFYDTLGRLNEREGLTIVLVTHDTGIVNRHVRCVACLNQRLIYHGSHAEFCSAETLHGLADGGHHLVAHRH